jgi:hypothetical protein
MDLYYNKRVEKETRKLYIFLIIATVFFAVIAFYLGWLDNGPRLFL